MAGVSRILEVAIASAEDAVIAAEAGADRVELNSGLFLGGLTPSAGVVIETRASVTLPVIVLIRPRPGGFCYTRSEFRVIERDIDFALAHGADGIAFGVLLETGEIDRQRCAEIVRRIGSRQVVFHRAFDVTPEPAVALEQLIDLGVQRVMTSGQEASAYEGASLIANLRGRAAGRIEILPAGGINRFTVRDVVERTGCNQVHASLRAGKSDGSTRARPRVRFGAAAAPSDEFHDGTSPETVRLIRRMLDEIP